MRDTKERILHTALHLFAQDGYEAVSVSRIADALGFGKSALYKHYQSKRDIFDHIVARMEQLDAERARQFELPEGTRGEMGEAYRHVSLKQLRAFCLAQFAYWTQEDFPASFRKMLTLEQYRSAEMHDLYQQYLVAGPLGYAAELLDACGMKDAQERAVALYAPMFLYYSLYDGAQDKAAVQRAFQAHMDSLWAEWEANDE